MFVQGKDENYKVQDATAMRSMSGEIVDPNLASNDSELSIKR